MTEFVEVQVPASPSVIEVRVPASPSVIEITLDQSGVRVGGSTGQVLAKVSGTDYDTQWVTPTGGAGPTWTVVEVDFGATPAWQANFTIVDAAVTAPSKVSVISSGVVASGRVGNDAEWDNFLFAALPAAGSFLLSAIAFPGPVVGRRTVQYQIG